MITAKTIIKKPNMSQDIIRIPKAIQQKEYFQSLQDRGLINYADRGCYEKWHWQYLKNPFYEAEDLACWIYKIDGKNAGHLGAIPVELKVNAQHIKAAWAVDFLTLPEYRKRGIGRSLVEEAGKSFDLLLTVGQTDMSFNLFIKMGWKFLGCLPYYIKILDIKPLIQKKLSNSFIVNIVSVLANFLLKIYNFFKKPHKSKDIKVDIINNFDAEADLFWNEISGYFKIVVPRNKAYLNWKYDIHPDIEYVKLRAVRNNKICGYLVLHCIEYELSKKEGLIADLIVCPDDRQALETLLFAALEYFRKEHCYSLRCFINQEDIQKVLDICGFFQRRPYMRFLISKNIDAIDGTDNLANWHLTAGDCDIDR